MRRVVYFFIAVLFLAVTGCQQQENEQAEPAEEFDSANELAMVTGVHTAAQGLGVVAVDSAAGKVDTAMIKNFLYNIRYLETGKGYYFVNDYSNNNIIFDPGNPDLNGKNGTYVADRDGKYYIRDMSEKAKEGGGFVNYFWINPVDSTAELRESYVETIPGTSLYIGSGGFAK